jgi:hypothetical protein
MFLLLFSCCRYSMFKEHASSKTLTTMRPPVEVPLARNETCDESETMVLRSIKDPNRILVGISSMDMEKAGLIFADPAFVKMEDDLGVKDKDVRSLADPWPVGQGPTLSHMTCTMKVKDTGKWVKCFLEHATSTTGSWGYDVGITRGECCGESKTEVFTGFAGGDMNNGPDVVAVLMYDADYAKLRELSTHPNFLKMTIEQGEIAETKVVKTFTVLQDFPTAFTTTVKSPGTLQVLHAVWSAPPEV